jgi:hypothetical protein
MEDEEKPEENAVRVHLLVYQHVVPLNNILMLSALIDEICKWATARLVGFDSLCSST